jgi:hypothetical protein
LAPAAAARNRGLGRSGNRPSGTMTRPRSIATSFGANAGVGSMRQPETKNRQGGAPKGERIMEKVRAAPCQRGTNLRLRRSAAPHWEAAEVTNSRVLRCRGNERCCVRSKGVVPDEMESAQPSQDGHRFRVEAGSLRTVDAKTGPCACYLTRTARRPIDTPRICPLTTLRKRGMNPAFSRIAYGSPHRPSCDPFSGGRVNVRSWDKSSLLGHPLGQHKSWADKNLSSAVPLSRCPAPLQR